MHRVIFLFFFLLFYSVTQAQDITVTKKVLGSPGANLFYENPSLALNTKTGTVLVVWERHAGNHPDHSTVLRKISPRGRLKGPIETIKDGTNTYDPQILYNSNENEFVLVFADEFENPVHTIFIQKLNTKGRIKGLPVQISTDSGSSFVNQHPFAAFDRATNRYVIVWTRNSTAPEGAPDEGIYAAVLDENLLTIAGPSLIHPVIADDQNPQVRDLAIHPSGKALVAFTESVDGVQHHYYVAAIDQDLTNLNVKRVTKTPVISVRVDASFASLSSSFFLYFVDSSRIRKRKIDELGKPAGAISSAFGSTLKKKQLFVPRFVAVEGSSGATQGLLAAIEDPSQAAGNGRIWVQRIAANGKPIGPPSEVDSGFISASELKAVMLPSTANELRFSIVYKNGFQRTLPPQGEFSELIHLKLAVPVP